MPLNLTADSEGSSHEKVLAGPDTVNHTANRSIRVIRQSKGDDEHDVDD